jgi:hypothetical protein
MGYNQPQYKQMEPFSGQNSVASSTNPSNLSYNNKDNNMISLENLNTNSPMNNIIFNAQKSSASGGSDNMSVVGDEVEDEGAMRSVGSTTDPTNGSTIFDVEDEENVDFALQNQDDDDLDFEFE